VSDPELFATIRVVIKFPAVVYLIGGGVFPVKVVGEPPAKFHCH